MDYVEILPTPVSHADRRRLGSTDGKRSRSTNPVPKAPVRDRPVPTSTSARPAASTSARPTASTSTRPTAFSSTRPAAPIPSTSDRPEAPAASISTQAHPPAALTDAVQLLAGLPPAALAAMLQQALTNQAQYYPVIPVDIIVCNNVITRLPGVKFPGGTAIHDTYGARAAPSAASYCTFTISGERFPGVRFPGRTAIHDTYGGRAAPSAASEGPLGRLLHRTKTYLRGPNVIEEVVTEFRSIRVSRITEPEIFEMFSKSQGHREDFRISQTGHKIAANGPKNPIFAFWPFFGSKPRFSAVSPKLTFRYTLRGTAQSVTPSWPYFRNLKFESASHRSQAKRIERNCTVAFVFRDFAEIFAQLTERANATAFACLCHTASASSDRPGLRSAPTHLRGRRSYGQGP
ncbi:hypothetical protein C8R45DRAFT_940266 [Mycena sanguinolenta]|nr:hypothetical protein C8R45DRAFT_940266 [Mycena sanguinolenta]